MCGSSHSALRAVGSARPRMMRISRLIRSQRVTLGRQCREMKYMRTRHVLVSLIALVVTGAASATGSATDFAAHGPVVGTAARYIVQATTARAAAQDVARVGGQTDQDLAIIRAVSAHLNPEQVARLRSR